MFCDNCDRGYHSYCVGLKSIPDGACNWYLVLKFLLMSSLMLEDCIFTI